MVAAVRPGREWPRPPSAEGRVTARGRGLTPPACGTLYGLTDGRGCPAGEGMGLCSNSHPHHHHKMATDLSPRRERRVKGQAQKWWDTGGRESECRKHPSVEGLFESRS